MTDPASRAEVSGTPALTVRSSQPTSNVIPGRYIVTFKTGVSDASGLARHLAASAGGTLHFTYTSAFPGFAADLPDQALEGLRHNPQIAAIEPDQVVQVSGVESNATWGLDRSDQRELPLDGQYGADRTGSGVVVYIIDTGIRYDHVEFGGRARPGYDAIGGDGSDCYGHGTHVAGTVGGQQYGVAKATRLVSVRVLDCAGSGSLSSVVAGLNWLAAQSARPAVANMSLGGGASDALDTALKGVINAGISVAVAAGNSDRDACNYSPARVPEALTVGATDVQDTRASFSNWGNCLDLFAPGVGITSAFYTGPTALKVWSGTSMASPHVAGVAALFLEDHPTAAPAEVADSIVAFTTKAVVQNAWSIAHNLLYSRPLVQRDTTAPPPAPEPPAALSASVGNLGRTTVVNLAWSSGSAPVAESEIQRKTSDGAWQIAAWTFDGWSQYQDPYVSGGQTYTYRVRSSTPYGTTGWSQEVTVTVGNAKKGGGRGK